MRNIDTIMTQLTDPKIVVRALRETLHRLDPAYPDEEEKFLHGVAQLKEADGVSSAEVYLAEKEQELAGGLIYIGWLGFQFNVDCFHNPVNKLLLGEDYEDIHREGRIHTLPVVRDSRAVIDAFERKLSDEKLVLLEGIASYYAYLQTMGYKLAHYFGFRLADKFLEHVLPGYTSDMAVTNQYKLELGKYLKIDLDLL